MKKYYVSLILLTIVLIVAAFCTLWFAQGVFQTIMPFIPLYFAVITGLQHYAVVKSFYKDPRTFVKNFLGLTVGTLTLLSSALGPSPTSPKPAPSSWLSASATSPT